MNDRPARHPGSLLIAAVLLTQVAGCLRVPGNVRAELEPEEPRLNHFAVDPDAPTKPVPEAGDPR